MTAPASPPSPRRERPRIAELMLLIAGAGLGLALFGRGGSGPNPSGDEWMLALAGLLGGVSLVGVPMLLREPARRRARWGAGRLLWFAQGSSAWLLWPPVVYYRARGRPELPMSGICYFYGTPLMAIYMGLALLARGGCRCRRGRRRRARPRSWRESFGLGLNLAWACVGVYVLYLIYTESR
jgi:hypothetical protein